MTRIFIALVAIAVVAAMLYLGNEPKLPDPVEEVLEENPVVDVYQDVAEIAADPVRDDTDSLRTGRYAFEIDASRFVLDFEYNRYSDVFTIRNKSELVSKLQRVRRTEYRPAYHNHQLTLHKLWATGSYDVYLASYRRRIWRGWGVCGSGAVIDAPDETRVAAGIGLSYAW